MPTNEMIFQFLIDQPAFLSKKGDINGSLRQ
jgi:hypothetical protein